MVNTTTNAAAILSPADVAALFVQPLLAASVAAQTATVVQIGSKVFRIPRVSEDPSAGWVAEGAEIPVSDAVLDEIEVVPSKLAGLTIVTRELADDSTPEASQVVGQGLARDCARKMDAAFFGNVTGGIAPAGLGALSGLSTVSAGTAWKNVDAFTEALYVAAGRNAAVTSWVANPTDALALSTIKAATGSNVGLLTPDPTTAGRSVIGGVPLLTSPAVPAGSVYGIAQSVAYLVVRDDVQVEADRSVFFTSDRVAVRARMRVGFGFPDPLALVKITKGA